MSLLRRVRTRDADAWERLCSLYGPIVYGWCRRAGLQDSDAADATQDVFRTVFRSIGDFRGHGGEAGDAPAGSFRGWLWVITRNQVRFHFRRQETVPLAFGGSDARNRFTEQAEVTVTQSIADADDPEPDAAATRCRIVHAALELVRGDFNPTTWAAFTRVTLQGHSPQEVAADLGMTENAVRQAKFRVLRRLRDELDGQF